MKGRKPKLEDIEPGSERFSALAPAMQAKVLALRESTDVKAAKKKAAEAADKAVDAEDFWSVNRSTLKKEVLSDFLKLQERVEEMERWMADGWKQEPSLAAFDAAYTNLKKFCQETGAVHDYFFENEELKAMLDDVGPNLFWLTRDTYVCEKVYPSFFTGPQFALLCAENKETEVYCKYGFKVALNWSVAAHFKQMIEELRAADYSEPLCGLCATSRKTDESFKKFKTPRVVKDCSFCHDRQILCSLFGALQPPHTPETQEPSVA